MMIHRQRYRRGSAYSNGYYLLSNCPRLATVFVKGEKDVHRDVVVGESA